MWEEQPLAWASKGPVAGSPLSPAILKMTQILLRKNNLATKQGDIEKEGRNGQRERDRLKGRGRERQR